MPENETVMDLAEAKRRHPDKWLALEVVERDEQQAPARVKVLAVADDRQEVSRQVRDVYEVYITFSGPIGPGIYSPFPDARGYMVVPVCGAGAGLRNR